MIEGSILPPTALDPVKHEANRLSTGYPIDPNAVIAAAFTAGTVPKSPTVARSSN